MSVINATPLLAAAGGDYQISRSVRLRSSASAYFNRTPTSASNRKTWTFSGWIKRGQVGVQQQLVIAENLASNYYFYIRFLASDIIEIFDYNATGGVFLWQLATTQVFRDPSAWYHITYSVDTTQATAANRVKLYVNGVQVSAFSTATYPTQNFDTQMSYNGVHNIGRYITGTSYFDGYLTEVNFIDGQALTPSSFGETDSITGVWKPKKYAGTYGTNGFYLNFSDNSSNTATTIGKDYSGNGNNWTPNNISVTAGVTYDSMLDVPTLYADGGNGRGNYAVLNPLKNFGTTLSAANLQGAFTPATAAAWQVHGSMAMTSGKWYWEVFLVSAPTTNGIGIGVALDTANVTTQNFTSGAGWLYYTQNGNKYNTGAAAYGSSSTTNDVIGVALDMDAGTLTFYKNNVSQGQAFSGLSGNSLVALIGYDQSGTSSFAINFGQRPFAYTPPTGFKALNTQNLPEPTIKKGNQYFNAVTWTGANSTGSRSVTGVGFQPDFVWAKRRDAAADHLLYDAIRGAGSNKELTSSSTAAEGGTNADSYDYLSSFDSDGFSSTWSGSNTAYYFNTLNATYVAWNWKANGAGSSNTAGSITATVSANASAGFSISTYTGTGANATIGHGLGVAPKMVIVKNKSSGSAFWTVYHSGLTSATYAVFLNATNAQSSSATYWNSTAPASSVFSVGTSPETNANGSTYVAYLFAEVSGFSKFGSYTGNGSADGPFVFCGFRPRYVMIKRTDSTSHWRVVDTARATFNANGKDLYPNLSNAEGSVAFDFLSNGFKPRVTDPDYNASGATYIYAAFAESPFKNSLAR